MGGHIGLSRLDFDAGSAPPEYQFELFHDTTAPIFDTAAVGPVESFAARTTNFLVEDLVVSRLRHRPQIIRRAPRHLGVADDVIAVQVYLRGSSRGSLDGAPLALDGDHVGVLDFGRPLHAVTSDVDVLWVAVPRGRLSPTRRDIHHGPQLRLHRNSPRGRVLAGAVEDLWSRLADAHAEDATRLGDEIVEVIETVLAPGEFVPSAGSLGLAIRRHIEANLADADMTADSLARTFHCSRATLYRVFKDDGGVARYIRERRLERCLSELTAPGARRRTVGHVARRWGFENPSHFNRLFKAQFGHAPSIVKGDATELQSVPHDAETARKIERFHDWASAI